MADVRTYIKVHDGIADHPKIEGLSDRAFRLLIETWCWCSRHLTDGKVPRATWIKRGTAKARSELIAAELVDDLGDVVLMHDYTEHQRSAAEVEERRAVKRRASLKGNHQRWHTGPDGTPDPACEHCAPDPGPIPPGSQVGSQVGHAADPTRDNGRNPLNTEVEVKKVKNSPPRSAQGLDRFDEFYAAYPRHIDRKDAEKAWSHAIKAHPPGDIIKAAKRYADAQRGKEAKFTKYPATWLNKGGYLDEPELRLVSGEVPESWR